jgi:hypothetical protein
MKRNSILKISIIILFGLLLWMCDENPFHSEKESNPYQNKPPETYLFLFVVPDTAAGDTVGIDTTASKQILHWWGEDSDGGVIGYYYQWDYQAQPEWTTSESDTFYVPIRTDYDQFTFRVWAVDDDSLMDPTPAVQTFPVFNSKPQIEFKIRSNPPAPGGNPDVIAYTFPTRTFIWDVNDPDGVETITNIYYAVDDTSTWIKLPGTQRDITLSGLSPGEHKFYVKAEDIAGAQSATISFPDPEDSTYPNTWVVKEPVGDVLLVNDFAQDQTLFEVQNYYEQILTNIVGADGYSTWEIGTSTTPVINPQNSLPYATADIRANLGYFKKVIWFAHLGRPNLAAAGLSLTQYMGEGGKVFITNGNEEIPDTTWTFTRIDSVFRLNPGGRLLPGIEVLSSLAGSSQDDLLDLQLGKLVGNRVSSLIPGPGAEIVYRMEPDSTASVAVPYQGSPAVGLRYTIGSGKSIYFSLPLHFCDGKENMEDVIRYILEEEFK